MKQGIHPESVMATISCACGAVYKVPSTRKEQKLEICSACHPFFTGKQRFVDTAGRVEKFRQRYGKKGAESAPEAEAETAAAE